MSVTLINPNNENNDYYQFELIHNFKPIQGYLKNDKNSDFFEIENPVFVDSSPSKIKSLDNIIFLSKSQVLYYFKINKN